MTLVATTPAVTGATRPDFSSRIVTLAASMASLCLIVPVLIFAARIIKSSPVLNALFFPRLPILAILFFSAVGVAGYGRLKGLGERWLHDLVETSSEQLAAWGEKERSTALYSTITVLSGSAAPRRQGGGRGRDRSGDHRARQGESSRASV
jgi:hypothetical protein